MKLGELEVGTEIDIEVKIAGKEWLFHGVIPPVSLEGQFPIVCCKFSGFGLYWMQSEYPADSAGGYTDDLEDIV